MAAFVVALLLVPAACGGDGDTTAPTSVAPTTSTTTTAPARPADADGAVDQTPPTGTNGIVAVDGRLYVADLAGDQIVSVDASTGEIVARWGAADGVVGPDDVALADDGALWFTGFRDGRVGRIDPDGTVEIVARLPAGANPIAFAPDGRLFVGLAVTADGLYEIDPSGDAEPRQVSDALGNVNAFAFGPDGSIYGPRFGLAGDGAVVRIDPATGTVEEVATGLDYPVAVRFAPDGALLVAQLNPPSILPVDGAAGTLGAPVVTVDHAIDNFAFDESGRMFVTTFDRPEVTEVLADGTTRTLRLGG